MKRVIHINQAIIKRNLKTGRRDPCVTVKTYKSNNYADEVIIRDKQGNEICRVVTRLDDPLPCGARCWVAVTDKGVVELVGAQEVKACPANACSSKNKSVSRPSRSRGGSSST